MKHQHMHRRPGRPGGWQQADQPDATDAGEWFAGPRVNIEDWQIVSMVILK